jgi:hypothetical protein
MINNLKLLLLIVILILPVKAQSVENLTGNLSVDSKILFEENNFQSLPQLSLQTESAGKKSPLLAGLFSFIIPGAGEFYAGNYLKTAIFVALEAAVITTAIIYDNKGNNQTEKFEKYADENWSVVKYAEWLVQFKDADRSKIIISDDESLPPWERVNWAELNAAEFGTHDLYPHGEQQYYELIGKYHEYSTGWDDYDQTSADYKNVSPHFTFYSGERGKANDYYNIASKAVIGIYINHFLSVLDAIWTTVQYNNSLAMKVRLEKVYFADRIELVPTLKFSYGF